MPLCNVPDGFGKVPQRHEAFPADKIQKVLTAFFHQHGMNLLISKHNSAAMCSILVILAT